MALRLMIPVQFGSFRFSILTPAQPLTQTITEVAREPVSGPSRQEVYQNVERLYIQQGRPVSTPQVQQEIQTEVEKRITVPTLGQIATWIWLAGVAGMSLWFLYVNLRWRARLCREAKPLEGTDSPVPVLVSGEVTSPCLVGLFRPAIYLTPEGAKPEHLSHVLAHELTHYRHKDHVWAFVRCLCLCVYWFNPLVWLAAFFSRRDCELACDEGALKRLGENQRIAYGKTLLHIVAHAGTHTRLLQTATTMNETKRQLKERVNFIVKKPKVWITAAIAMVLVCAICFGCAIGGGQVTEPGNTGEPVAQGTEPVGTTEAREPEETGEPQRETGPMGGILLTEEEVRRVNSTVAQMGSYISRYFMQPETIDLTKLLRSVTGSQLVTDAEMDAIQEELGLEDQEMPRTRWTKRQKKTLDETMIRWMGMTSDMLYTGPSFDAVYLEEYDCYYQNPQQYTVDDPALDFLCDGGEVVGDKAYLYGTDPGSGRRGVLTLHQRDGQWYLYSHLPANMVTVRDSTPLTIQQIRQVNQAFYPEIYYEKNGYEYVAASHMSCFFMSTYACPEEMDLARFLRNYPDMEFAMDEEWAAADEAYAEAGMGNIYPQCLKMKKEDVDEVLLSVMGITSDVLYHGVQSNLVYVEEYDAYFNGTSDFENATFDCFGGEICGDVAYLYSSERVLTLIRQSGKWYIYSHLTMEEFAVQNETSMGGVPLTGAQIQQVNEAFASQAAIKNGEHTSIVQTVAGRFFTSYYSSPQEMNLELFFYNYPGTTPASEEERAAAGEVLGYTPRDVPCRKCEKSALDETLMKWMGITSDGMYQGPSHYLVYVEEYDAYYGFASDVYPAMEFECVRGEICGDVAYLFSRDAALTLVRRDDKWYIYSHLTMKDFAATKSGQSTP